MSNQKHTVSTDALDTLGTCPIPEGSGRDAIHLAVEPVKCGPYHLDPGQLAVIVNGVACPADRDVATGIVDPFVDMTIYPGQMFWFVVLPRTITSLRHVWSHPAFPEAKESHQDNDPHYVFHIDTSESVSKADMARFVAEVDKFNPEQSMAMARMKEWCNEIGERYDYIMAEAKKFVDSGGTSYTYGEHDSGKFDSVDMPDWFWSTYQEIVRSEVPQEVQHSFFTCSC